VRFFGFFYFEATMTREFLDTRAVAEMLNRSEAAIRNLVLRKAIPYRKPGGRLMFLRSEICEWIENAPGLSLAELKKQRIVDK